MDNGNNNCKTKREISQFFFLVHGAGGVGSADNRTAAITASKIYLIVISNVTIIQHNNYTNTIQENVKKVTKW